jgi:endo-1,4-beta-D-glucanase Y
MPSESEKASRKIESEIIRQKHFVGQRLSDSYLELAALYQQRGDYENARKFAEKIIDFKFAPTVARPNFYDEAIFLTADARRIQAVRQNQPGAIGDIMRFLAEKERNLKPDEHGYKSRYALELLRTCVIYQESFVAKNGTREIIGCSPQKVDEYSRHATVTYNSYAPRYDDNFIAVKALLENANYKLAAAKNSDDIGKAIKAYDEVIKAIDSIDPFSVAKFLRKITGSTQFDPKLFSLFRSQVYRGQAQAEAKLAELAKNAQNQGEEEAHLINAKQLLEKALGIMRQIKSEKIWTFHTAAMFEEKQVYHKIIGDYVETLLALFYLKGKTAPQEAPPLLGTKELEDLSLFSDNPSETNYLRALVLFGELKTQLAITKNNTEVFKAADEIYVKLISQIKNSEQNQLTPYHRHLLNIALFRRAELFLAWPRVKSVTEIEEQIENLRTAVKEMGKSKAENAFYLDSAPLIEGDLLLAQADAEKNLAAAAATIDKAEEIFLGFAKDKDAARANRAKARLLEIAIRRSAFVEFVQPDIKKNGFSWEFVDREFIKEKEYSVDKLCSVISADFTDFKGKTIEHLNKFMGGAKPADLVNKINEKVKNKKIMLSTEEYYFIARVGKVGMVSGFDKRRLLEIIYRQECPKSRKNKGVTAATQLIEKYKPFYDGLNSFDQLQLKHQVALLLSTLYIYRNAPADQQTTKSLSKAILDSTGKLPEPVKSYFEIQAVLNHGIASVQDITRKIEVAQNKYEVVDVSLIEELEEAIIKLELLEIELGSITAGDRVLEFTLDLPNFKAELFHQMTIAYSVLEDYEKKWWGTDNYLGTTYEYLNKTYHSCYLSSTYYNREFRPELLRDSFPKLKNAYDPENLYPLHPEYEIFMRSSSVNSSPDAKSELTWKGWKSRFIKQFAGGLLVQDFDPSNPNLKGKIVSERSGYGMFLASAFGDQPTTVSLFQGIEHYARKKSTGLYAWKMNETGTVENSDSAFDADLYIAYSLSFARTQQDRTQKLIDALWKNNIVERGGKLIIKPSDAAWPLHGDGKVVVNPSYFAPYLIKRLAEVDRNKKEHNWQKVIDDGYELIDQLMASSGKLEAKGQNPIPDTVLCQVKEGKFSFEPDKDNTKQDEMDAIRVMLEIGRDAITNHDPRAILFLKNFLAKARVTNPGDAKIQGYNNELAIALYAVAIKGAGDTARTLGSFIRRIDASFKGNYFGLRPDGKDADQYYKQSLILMARILL